MAPIDHTLTSRRRDWTRPLRRPLLWFATLLLTIAGAVLLTEPFEQSLDTPPPVEPENPDLKLEDAIITQFRDTGMLKYRLISPSISHFRSRAVTLLAKPDLSLHSEPDPPWRMTAARGTITNLEALEGRLEESVELEQDVRMSQKYPDGRAFELRTPSVTVYPDRQYARTSRNVMITTHAGRTHAVGLQGDLNRGLLQLFSDDDQRVHTILLPDQFK
jgi:LPS export ABC transporter protein LptC